LATFNYGDACKLGRKKTLRKEYRPNQVYIKIKNRIINPNFKAGFFWNDEKDMFLDNWVDVVDESWGEDFLFGGTSFCSKKKESISNIDFILPLTIHLIQAPTTLIEEIKLLFGLG
jgi:hypothetical protein